MTYSYFAYGARIWSYLPLAPLVRTDTDGLPDVRVLPGELDALPFAVKPGFQSHVAPGEVWIRHSQVGTFLAREGREIIVDVVPGVDERVVRSYVIKAALGAVLLQQGKLLLHGSAVAIGGAAVAFVGRSGMGKSTTSAALHARGHALLADDLVAVDVGAAPWPVALPGFPQVLLFSESASAVGLDPEMLVRASQRSDKYAVDAAGGYAGEPLPQHHVYALADAEHDRIEPMTAQNAMATLVAHTFGLFAFRQAADPRHFLLCAALAGRVPVRRLARARRLAGLPDLARMLEADCASNG